MIQDYNETQFYFILFPTNYCPFFSSSYLCHNIFNKIKIGSFFLFTFFNLTYIFGSPNFKTLDSKQYKKYISFTLMHFFFFVCKHF